jgi:hypothetical protein
VAEDVKLEATVTLACGNIRRMTKRRPDAILSLA